MNWYKENQSLDSLTDRNALNHRIKLFQEYAVVIGYLAKYIYQNPSHARESVKAVAESRELSSFPELTKILFEAYGIALDNYDKFSDFCKSARDKLVMIVKAMQEERDEFSYVRLPDKMQQRRKQ